MLGLFVLLTTVSAALISQRDHHRGLGLALMITAGLGLGSPQLVLMLERRLPRPARRHRRRSARSP
jgi:hypothetical protein